MSNYTSTKAAINAAIKANGQQQISGPVLNTILTAMVNNLGDGYRFAGLVTPASAAITTDNRVFVIANTAGTYTNFGGLTVLEGELAAFLYRVSWTKVSLFYNAGKADKVQGATSGDLAGLDENGNLTDSGKKASDFATAIQGAKADTAYQKPASGIPSSDMTETVRTSLGKADTSVQPADIADFITRSVNDLANYYLKTETYTQSEVNALIAAIKQFTYEVVAVLPAASASTMNKIYLVPASRTEVQNVKDEYITIDHGAEAETRYSWEQIGSTAIDLSAYSTTAQMNAAIAAYHDSSKQDVISDLVAIRTGAAAGATAYQKPASGIPSSDMDSTVQTSLGKADTALQSVPATYRTAAAQDEIDERKADKDGYYSTLTAGLAENLVGYKGTVPAKYSFRPTDGGSQSIGSGAAILKSVKGNAVVMNQLVQNGNFESADGWVMGEVTMSASNNILTVTAGAGIASYMSLCHDMVVSTHKYYFRFDVKSAYTRVMGAGVFNSEGQYTTFNVTENTWVKCSAIQTIETQQSYQRFDIKLGNILDTQGDVAYVKSVFVIDLTLMFGAGNEPQTASEFEALFPLDYYAYNAGAVIGNKTTGIKTNGFNQCPQTYEKIGNWNVFPFIRVIGGMTYYGKVINSSRTDNLYFDTYDSNQTLISESSKYVSTGGDTIIFGNDDFYVRPKLWAASGEELTFDAVVFNLSHSGYRNGEYEEFWENTKTLNIPTLTGKAGGQGESITIFPEGMMSAGSVHDEIQFSRLGVATKAIKRIGSREYQSGDESDTTVITDKTTTYFVLATPIEYTLDAELNGIYAVDDFGTEMQVPQNTSTPTTAPLLCDVQYAMNAEGEIRNLPKNYASIAPTASDSTIKNLLTAMQSAGVIAGFTIAWDNTNQRYTFTITPAA